MVSRLAKMTKSLQSLPQNLNSRCFSNQLAAKRTIDLRSDAVTKPSKEMLQVMHRAGVSKNDGVFTEDERVLELEKQAAELFGMEKALFVPTGVMGNLLCIMAHCNGRGEELIVGRDQHVYRYEQGHFMQLASVAANVLPNEMDGTINIKHIENIILGKKNFNCCHTKLICLENTHMGCGGIPLSNEYLNQIGSLSKSYNIPIHVDGARLFNASVATKLSVKELLVNVDSVMLSLNKSLGCSVGAVIGGSEQIISNAIRGRKAFGGRLRQAGFLAAAGMYALEHSPKHLQNDHDNAKLLGECINSFDMHDVVYINPRKIQTNILYLECKSNNAVEIVSKLKEYNVMSTAFTESSIRLVTHRDVNTEDILNFKSILEEILKDYR